MTTLQKIRAKIIEAVPEAGLMVKDGRKVVAVQAYGRPISLADVLRAIEHRKLCSWDGEVEYSAYGNTFLIGKYASSGRNGAYSKCYWNLALPLDEQEPAVHEFLAEVLGV